MKSYLLEHVFTSCGVAMHMYFAVIGQTQQSFHLAHFLRYIGWKGPIGNQFLSIYLGSSLLFSESQPQLTNVSK